MTQPMAGHAELDPEVILQHAGFVRSLARGLLRDEALVDDVVQETLLRALEKGPRRREALVAWLRTVTRNIAFKSYRGAARRAAREEEVARPERLPATFDLVAKGETLSRLTAAVMELPEPAREIILLRYYEGLGNREIAARLGIGQGAVRMRVHRAQKTLTESLDRSTDGDRGTWMAGLAALAGVRAEDLAPEALESAAGTSLSGTAFGWLAAVGLALGVTLLFALPRLAPRFARTAEIDPTRAPADLASTAPLAGAEERLNLDQPRTPVTTRTSTGPAQPPAAEATDDTVAFPTGNLLGVVVDARGEPVQGARVQAAWGRFPMKYKATTDDRGRFGLDVPAKVFEDAQLGKYPVLLAATASGSAPTRVCAWPMEWSSAPSAQGAEDSKAPHAVLRLRGEGGSLAGVVIGARGSPLRGARVELGERTRFGLGFLGYQSAETENNLAPNLAATIERGERLTFKGNRDMRGTLGRHVVGANGHRSRLQPARLSKTRANGTFRFGGIEPGVQRMRITAPGHAAWTGYVDVARGPLTEGRFRLGAEATVSGAVRREDGLPLVETLVHALQTDPWNVSTVRVAADGTYTLRGLRPGPLRVVAEERAPGGDTPPRIAEEELVLEAGSQMTVSLTLHDTPTRPVRFLMRDESGLHPLAGQRVDLRGRHNPLLTVAVARTDAEGRVDIPTETVVPCIWLLVGDADWRELQSSKGEGPAHTAPVAVIEPPPEFSQFRATTEEVVVEIDAESLVLCNAKLDLVSATGAGAAQNVVLLPRHGLFNLTGRPGGGSKAVVFRSLPAGRYQLLVPYHGLGWLAPAPVDVPALGSAVEFDLGTLRLPALGSLGLRPSVEIEGTRWLDMTIQALQGERQIRVFDGRIEIPASIPLAPGRYVLRTGRERDPYVREIVIREGQRLDVLWPIGG